MEAIIAEDGLAAKPRRFLESSGHGSASVVAQSSLRSTKALAVEYAPPGASEKVSVPMALPGGPHRASLGPFATEGTDDATIELTVLARDGAGNAISKSAGTILVHDCTFL